jgi:glycosyltransferase involved in cell wall biosynthesis|uniref:Glycosyl transferase, family 2 n=1 Tax=Leptospirillum ferrodiazotrophum TaxID=412449 RepID=C6I0N3_9BACT|nr:MAG: glycosyl transferase, family 2 [Leptospirillum ferrodiazotrophum]
MHSPRVSIVIPLYKGGCYAKEAISSALSQTYKNFEIILVDNNASDETRNYALPFVKEFPEKVRLIHEVNQGVSFARNKGILEAKGQLIALLDDDDIMYSDKLQRQVEVFDKYPDSAIISCWDDRISYDGKILSPNNVPTEIFWVKILLGETQYYKNSPFIFHLPSTMLFPREKAIACGLYDVRFSPSYMTEDVDFEFRMYKLGYIKVVSHACIAYRFTEGAFEEQKWNGERIRSFTQWAGTNIVFTVMQEYLDLPPSIYRNKLRKIQSQWLREFACFLMRFPEKRSAAKRLFKRALLAQPFDYKAWKSFLRSYYPSRFYAHAFHFESDARFPSSFSFPDGFEETYFSISSRFL